MKSVLTRTIANNIQKRYLRHNVSYDLFGPKVDPNDEKHEVACFMHGILGTKRNWRTPAQKWRAMFPQYSCLSFDHRGHGASTAIHKHSSLKKYPHNDIKSCAFDLIKLINVENIKPPSIIIGHSFSGKVALQYLLEVQALNQNPFANVHIKEPSHVWVVDSTPGRYKEDGSASSSSSVLHIFEILNKIPSVFPSKEWIINELIHTHGIERSIVMWLATNIVPHHPKAAHTSHTAHTAHTTHSKSSSTSASSTASTSTVFTWGFDLSTINDLFLNYSRTDMWHMLENYHGNTHIHFIRAGMYCVYCMYCVYTHF